MKLSMGVIHRTVAALAVVTIWPFRKSAGVEILNLPGQYLACQVS